MIFIIVFGTTTNLWEIKSVCIYVTSFGKLKHYSKMNLQAQTLCVRTIGISNFYYEELENISQVKFCTPQQQEFCQSQ